MKITRMVGAVLACATVIGLSACGSSFDDICSKETSCLGGNDKDKQACVDSAEAAKKEASDYGCSQQFSDWQTCITAGFSCTTQNNCGDQATKIDECKAGASSEKGNH